MDSLIDGVFYIYGTSAQRTALNDSDFPRPIQRVVFKESGGSDYEWDFAASAWVETRVNGAALVYGLPATARVIEAETYNTTNIVGFKILNVGTGNLTLSPASGDTDIVVTAAELALMGINAYVDWLVPELDSITAGTGMKLLVFHR